MLKIRLRRMGARNRPYYRIVVSDSRSTARAEVLEELGSYDPVPNPPALSFDRERARHWIAKAPTCRRPCGRCSNGPRRRRPRPATPAASA